MKLTETQVLGLQAVLSAVNTAFKNYQIVVAQMKRVYDELGLDPAKRYEIKDGDVSEVTQNNV